LRVSQINGCAYCIDMHSRDLITYGGTKSEVMRRFVEEGIRVALNNGRIAKRNIDDYGGPTPSQD
jgi:hypothetical protein